MSRWVEGFRQLKKWATHQPRIRIAVGAIGVAALGYLLYLLPLTAVHRAGTEATHLKKELTEARQTVDKLRKGEVPVLSEVGAVPDLLAQLNAVARTHQVEFLEVVPGTPRAGGPKALVLLPVDLYLEGSYRSLGEFLGALRQTPSLGAAYVERIHLEREDRLLPRMRARLSVTFALREASTVVGS